MEGGKRSRLLTCSASGRSHVKAVERRKPDSKAIHYIYIILYDDTLEKTKPQKQLDGGCQETGRELPEGTRNPV